MAAHHSRALSKRLLTILEHKSCRHVFINFHLLNRRHIFSIFKLAILQKCVARSCQLPVMTRMVRACIAGVHFQG